MSLAVNTEGRKVYSLMPSLLKILAQREYTSTSWQKQKQKNLLAFCLLFL